MGDRAVMGIEFVNGQRIFLYSHWGGEDAKIAFRRGLDRTRRAGRLTDEAYGARLIIQEYTRGGENGDLGLGVSPYDDFGAEHDVFTFRFKTQDVVWTPGARVYGDARSCSVEDFIVGFEEARDEKGPPKDSSMLSELLGKVPE